MPFIKAKNGNVVEFYDPDLGRRALLDGHEVTENDPRGKAKAKTWTPDGDAPAGDDSGSE